MRRENISIDLLLLSDGNPRLEPSLGEDEAIFHMVSDQNYKLFELAEDIVQHGLNPLDTIGVYPSETYNGFYEVGEGNRRVCSIKLLIAPSRIKHINDGLYTKFSDLSKLFSIPSSIEVGVFENESDMRHWMEIRHMGEQGGKGLAKWNSVQKMRFQKFQTGSDALLDFWGWMITENILSESDIFSVTKTNWQRVLREPYYQFLKISFKDGSYSVDKNNILVFTERINAIQKKLKGQTVAIVYDQVRIDYFYNQISQELYGIPYQNVIDNEREEQLKITSVDFTDNEHSNITLNKNKSNSEYTNAEDPENNGLSTADSPQSNLNIPRDLFNGCNTIIPYSYSIRSSNMRINKIINELKKLNADEYPNACGTLLRTLFELSAKVLIEKETGIDQTSTEFQQAIRAAANSLRTQTKITNSQHSAITNDIDSLRKIFNGYMHDTDGYPSSEALKNFFKAHKSFIEECIK